MRYVFGFLIWFSVNVYATPAMFSYQGRIFDESGEPLESGTANVVFQVLSPSADCLLYEETHDVLMENSAGYFRVSLGFGTKNVSTAPNYIIENVFSNMTTFSDVNLGCASYSPNSYDHRLLRVTINGETLTPDQVISSVPYSLQAGNTFSVGGKSYQDIKDYSDQNFAGNVLPDLSGIGLGESIRWGASGWELFTPGTSSVTAGVGLDVSGADFIVKAGTNISVDSSGVNVSPQGAGSGLNSDLLDGQEGSYYLSYNNMADKPSVLADDQVSWSEVQGIPSVFGDGVVSWGEVTGKDVAGTVLSGFVAGADVVVSNTDSVEVSIEKLQGQVSARVPATRTINGKNLGSNISITKSDVGLNDIQNIKDNLSASNSPTVNDDIDLGYAVGSRWYDTTNGRVYTCLDAADGSALWKKISDQLDIDGTTAMAGNLDMASNKITNLATPTGSADAATKAYVDAAGGGTVDPSIYSMTANSGMYDNRIPDFTPPAAYTEVCFKGGATQYDNHSVSESTSGGNCVPGDVGYIIETSERTATYFELAKQTCLENGMRLPEPFEWKLSCKNAATWGMTNMTNNWEWASNFALPMYHGSNSGVGAAIFGNGGCHFATWGWLGRYTGGEGSPSFRCVR